VAITDPADAASTGKIFTILLFNHFSLSTFTPYWSVAEETLTDQAVGSPSPLQDSAPASPRIQPASPQLEVSAIPNHPASPQPATQESPLEPEKLPSPIREARNDVRMNTHLFYFHLIDYY
jgi:hypothetical protein